MFLDLEQNLPMGGVGGNFTGGKLDSEFFVGGEFTIDLIAKATSTTDFSMLELASCRVAVSVNMCCLQSAEISVACLSNPRLVSTQNFVPSPLTESISTSISCRPNCSETLHPEDGIISQYTFHFCFRVITHVGISTTSCGDSLSFKCNCWLSHKDLFHFCRFMKLASRET